MRLVISQPMFLPWIGMFEQIKLADVFVHYDDVQFSKGGFVSRVQLKSAGTESWLTAPIDWSTESRQIDQLSYANDRNWRQSHLSKLKNTYAHTPFFSLMYELAEEIYAFPDNNVAEFNIHALERIARWLGLRAQFVRSSQLPLAGKSSERVLNLCVRFSAKEYITGLGALNYLDHQLFEEKDIRVCYMNYEKQPYPQGEGAFTPYVSILDAIAQCGDKTRNLLVSTAIYWKDRHHE